MSAERTPAASRRSDDLSVAIDNARVSISGVPRLTRPADLGHRRPALSADLAMPVFAESDGTYGYSRVHAAYPCRRALRAGAGPGAFDPGRIHNVKPWA